jgi:hypothetical protein
MVAAILFDHMHRYEHRLHHFKYCCKIKENAYFVKGVDEVSPPFHHFTLAALRIPAAFANANFVEKRSDSADTMTEN